MSQFCGWPLNCGASHGKVCPNPCQQKHFPFIGSFPLHCFSGEGAIVTVLGHGEQQLELSSGMESDPNLSIDT